MSIETSPMDDHSSAIRDEAFELFDQAVKKMFACYDLAPLRDDWTAKDRNYSALLDCLFATMEESINELVRRHGLITTHEICTLTNAFVRHVAEQSQDQTVTKQ